MEMSHYPLEMIYFPFPRGKTARGTPDGKMVVAREFLNQKGQPILNVLKGESELAQILIGTEFINKGIKLCLKAKNPDCEPNWSINRNINGCKKFGFFDDKTLNALGTIADIRNKISHADFAINLSAKEVISHVEILRTWLKSEERKWQAQTEDGKKIPGWTGALMNVGELTPDILTNRDIFLGSIIMLYVGLANIQWQINPESYTGATAL